MERTQCPFCGEPIATTAKKCGCCGEWLPEEPVRISIQKVEEKSSISQTEHASPVAQSTQSSFSNTTSSTPSVSAACAKNKIPQPLSFFQAYFVKPYLKRYADFKGFTSRQSFWLSCLATIILGCGLLGLVLLLSSFGEVGGVIAWAISGIVNLALIVPGIALCVRRLRDAGKNPWLYLLVLIPIAGAILLLYFFCLPSHEEDSEEKGKWGISDWITAGICLLLLISYPIISFTTNSNDSYDLEAFDDFGESGLSSQYESNAPSTGYETLNHGYMGLKDGNNHLEGDMIHTNGKRYPFTLDFNFDSSYKQLFNIRYKNIGSGTTIYLDGKIDEGKIIVWGKDQGKDFVMAFSGTDPYYGDAWWGDFHMDLELRAKY